MYLDLYESFIHKSRYARYLEEMLRRENWKETVERYCTYMGEKVGLNLFDLGCFDAIFDLRTMPSMRAIMTAGKALERDNVAGYNCAYIAIDNLKTFDEAFFVLLNGTGVGYSVERQFIADLPTISDTFYETESVIKVRDSKLGWAKALRELIAWLFQGQIPQWDVSGVRPAGSILKTFGGRASGSVPLVKLFQKVVGIIKNARGRKLHSIECHDIMCHIASAVVVGGVRRCVPQNAVVATVTGNKLIKDIKVGDYVVTGGNEYKVLDSGSSGKKQLIKIKHEFGELECTPDHRVAIFNEVGKYTFINASELKENDRLVWDTEGYAGNQQKLPNNLLFNEQYNTKTIRFPKYLSDDLSWLIGVIHGDGCVNDRSIEINTIDEQKSVLDQANSIFIKEFGISGKIDYDSHNGKCLRLRVNSKSLALWFSKYVKQSNQEIRIPKFIMNSHQSNRYAYLSGIFDADGRYRIADNVIEQCTTIYKKYKEDLVLLLSSLGIVSKVYFNNADRRRKKGVKAKDSYTINIKTYICKNRWYANIYYYSKSFKLPGNLEFSSNRDFHYPVSFLEKHPQGYRKGNNITSSRLCLQNNVYQPVKVLSVEEFKIGETWDIEVEQVNQFTTNGIVVHNSAMISLSNLSDDRMRSAKSGEWYKFDVQRALANNSACYTDKPDMFMFMNEWNSIYQSKSGERGIFNRQASQRMVPERRDSNFAFGTNPCSEIVLRSGQFCVSGDTPLITERGIHNIRYWCNNDINVWNGEEWTKVKVRVTGENQKLMRVKLNDGSYLDCTPEHRWSVKDRFKDLWQEVKTSELLNFSKYPVQIQPNCVKPSEYGVQKIHAYTLGFTVGDGCVYGNKILIDLYGEKDFTCPVAGTRGKPVLKDGYNVPCVRVSCAKILNKEEVINLKFGEHGLRNLAGWDYESVLQFIAGLADADGSNTETGAIRIYLSGETRARDLQLILTKNGIRSTVCLFQKAGTKTNLGVRKKDLWYLQITECQDIPCHRLDTSRGHKPKYKSKYQNIVSVEELEGLHTTYCFNEPKKHMGLFGNVLTYQCNLTEVVCRHDDTLEMIAEKIRTASILGTCQAALTDFRYLRNFWQRNTQEEALLGVSLTGIYDCKAVSNAKPKELEMLRDLAVKTNIEYAKIIGINPATAVTCVKPSGTVSQLVNAASGIHPRHNDYYIRRARNDKKDPLSDYMIEIGVPHIEDPYNKDAWAFEFPMAAPRRAVTRKGITALQHLETWKKFALHWCEHKPSITCSVREEEWMKVGSWVWDNFDIVNGISFLPAEDEGHSYEAAPYEDISKDKYKELLAKMPTEADWDSIAEDRDETTSMQEYACSAAGGCEI